MVYNNFEVNELELIYKINPGLDVPIYKQLVDTIRTAIKKGTLVSGQQLPTVQEMTEQLGIARGTIKRAYDELEIAGLVEKVQGRGTFVRYQPENSASRKEQAMAAIDSMLDSLEDMGLSAAEINIFLNLKLRERSEKEAYVKVALVECNPENLSQLSEQLRHINGIDLYSFMLDSIKQYPYQLGEDFDLIVTTSSHAQYLEGMLPVRKKLARIALRPSARFLSHVIKLRPGAKLGIVGSSKRFTELLYDTCKVYTEDITLKEPMVLSSEKELASYLRDVNAVLVPKYYDKHFGAGAAEMLRKFSGELIDCYFEMDEGSLMYIEAKIKRLLEEKTI